ncbi:HAD family hydrolase [Chryseolinea lacunae]|uniref:HAD family phosphatase n=1 Tax=Chryseolinea lacunae TaxID=2801331 RepID=A0ABS1KW04_9BACT|nr:HAD family phosphatase [Chryseolinea lacunae]MBL0743412.1 HAD family phosphatase [Chryseolinea lacunae]
MKNNTIDTVIFDLGGVLIDWNPRYLYRKIFKTEDEIDWFLGNVCTADWNDKQDGGRSFREATDELLALHPQFAEPINAWYDRWQETIQGSLPGTVDILKEIKTASKHRLYALTNWSAESFPWALDNFEFLHWFEGIVVSGVEKTRKPFPEFYQILFDRYNVDPARAIFIDDNHKNIVGANAIGLPTIHFHSPEQLRSELKSLGVLS